MVFVGRDQDGFLLAGERGSEAVGVGEAVAGFEGGGEQRGLLASLALRIT